MNTQSHAIINVSLLSRQDKPHLHRYALFGAVLPDFPMFVFFVTETFIFRHSQGQIWSERYFLPQWQNVFDIFNSVPFILMILGIGYWRKSDAVIFFCWSMLLHCAADFFLHRNDAHRHFFPFLQFTFRSPISYWDAAHYGLHRLIGRNINHDRGFRLSVFPPTISSHAGPLIPNLDQPATNTKKVSTITDPRKRVSSL